MVRLIYHKLHINKVVTERHYRNTSNGNCHSVRCALLRKQPKLPVRRTCAKQPNQMIFDRVVKS